MSLCLSVCKRLLLVAALLIFSFEAIASDIDRIVGRYEYLDYSFILQDGEVKGFESLGAKGATLEIHRDMTVILAMQMADGALRTQQARIVKLDIVGNKGFWLARWPDVSGLVRKDFTTNDGVISYQITFSEENGPVLNGLKEEGMLKKISGD